MNNQEVINTNNGLNSNGHDYNFSGSNHNQDINQFPVNSSLSSHQEQNLNGYNQNSSSLNQNSPQKQSYLADQNQFNHAGIYLDGNVRVDDGIGIAAEPKYVQKDPQIQENLQRLQGKISPLLDQKTGGLLSLQGMTKLVDAMKSEFYLDIKFYEMKILACTVESECLQEFMNKGGIAILVQWAKDIRAAQCLKESDEWKLRKDIFNHMITALNTLPITVGILKKTKIGKAINSIFKVQMFDSQTNESANLLVNRWKQMVKDYKKQEQDKQEIAKSSVQQEKSDQNYNQQNPENKNMQKAINLPAKRQATYDPYFLGQDDQDLKRRKVQDGWNEISQIISSSTSSRGSQRESQNTKSFVDNILNSANLHPQQTSRGDNNFPANSNQNLTHTSPQAYQQNQSASNNRQQQPFQRQSSSENNLNHGQRFENSAQTSNAFTSSKKKSVKWQPEEKLEIVKFFKMNDMPSAPGLSHEEVQEIQKHLANVPPHMIPSELKNIEMKLDREKLEEQKGKEQYKKEKLEKMQPLLIYRVPQYVDLGLSYKQARGEQSKDEQNQKQREKTVFQAVYINPNQIPQNPLKELDEHYAKDDKVPQIDCEIIANDYLKQKEDEKFQREILQLQDELQYLDEGKSFPKLRLEWLIYGLHKSLFFHLLLQLNLNLSTNAYSLTDNTLLWCTYTTKTNVQQDDSIINIFSNNSKDLRSISSIRLFQLWIKNQVFTFIASSTDPNSGQSLSHDETIRLVKQQIADFKQINEAKKALQPPAPIGPTPIQAKPFRTVPCRNYHGPVGCTRGEFCHFIHAVGFEQREIPRDVFQKIRNENMRKNLIDEIRERNPQAAMMLQNSQYNEIQNYVKQYNEAIGAPQANASLGGHNPMGGGMQRPNMMGMQNHMRPNMNNMNQGMRMPNQMNNVGQPQTGMTSYNNPMQQQQQHFNQQNQFRQNMNQMNSMGSGLGMNSSNSMRPPLVTQDMPIRQMMNNQQMNPQAAMMMNMNPNMMNQAAMMNPALLNQQNLRMPMNMMNPMMMRQMQPGVGGMGTGGMFNGQGQNPQMLNQNLAQMGGSSLGHQNNQ
ncbi:transcription elongation factor sii protein n terminal domain containing protein [Stylonychia lemnae]|uniref:Transcription elongation factor sii protein n terminal domain containing protein n=1 Tax=Stylonychia lemnae TaxID=5949 RepID=A0A078A3B4_STYLE|nr:transcription elongation factor sii protein n terminal domain containing protein [Stylonychia lemnae]|eukprot:CDW75998.1 transcription elongation factor sii protein n terminal domain containing protein [Stylonychia lemnae]